MDSCEYMQAPTNSDLENTRTTNITIKTPLHTNNILHINTTNTNSRFSLISLIAAVSFVSLLVCEFAATTTTTTTTRHEQDQMSGVQQRWIWWGSRAHEEMERQMERERQMEVKGNVIESSIQVEENIPVADRIILIGDVHGNIHQLRRLWVALEKRLGAEEFASSHVVFLGDYCDRGNDTRSTLDFLVELQKNRPNTHFIAGNHDMAMTAFLGLYDEPQDSFSKAWDHDPTEAELSEGWWTGPDYSTMHLQGRRWACDSNRYAAKATFDSYHVTYQDRDALINAVPEEHKQFLKNLPWMVELQGRWGERVVCVHAGLDVNMPVQEQYNSIKHRDLTVPRHSVLFGRAQVIPVHPSLPSSFVIASGHHGILDISEPNRLIVDESGGKWNLPIAAVVLPDRHIVRSSDVDDTVPCPI